MPACSAASEIFHPLQPSGYVEVNGTVCRNGDDYPTSWSLPYQQGVDRAAGCVGRCKCMQHSLGSNLFLPHKCRGTGYSNKGIEGPLTDFNDYNNAQATIATLRLLSNSTMNAPFFVACGFHRPCALSNPHLLFPLIVLCLSESRSEGGC